MDRVNVIETLIKKVTGVQVDGRSVWDEVEQAAAETIENGDQWVTGQDDSTVRWEYYVNIQHDAETDEDGETIQSWTDVRLLEIKIEPRSKNSIFYNGNNLNQPYRITIAGAKL